MAKNRRYESDCCSITFLKHVLYMFNALLVLAGLFVLGVGIWSVIDKQTYISLLTTVTYSLTVYVLLTAGVLILAIATIGFIAVARDQRCLLLAFTFLLLLIFVIEATIGLLAVIYQEQVEKELKMNLNNTFLEYYQIDTDRTSAIDRFQIDFKCCGAGGYEDWTYSRWIRENQNKGNLVPDSCCKTPSKRCGVRDHPSNIQYKGCTFMLAEQIKEHLTIIIAVVTGICVLQIFGIILSSCVYIKLKNDPRIGTS